MSESLSVTINEARTQYGDGFAHLLISWLKCARILVEDPQQIAPEVIEKINSRAFVKTGYAELKLTAEFLMKDDLIVVSTQLNPLYFGPSKVVGFDKSGLMDGVLSRSLDTSCLKFFDEALREFSGTFNGDLAKNKYLFLDRDGVIINYVSYPNHPSQVKLQSGIVEVIKEYRKRNHRIIMVTNQSGIARGYSTQEDFRQVQNRTLELLAQQGQWIDACYFATYLANSDVIQTLQYPSLRKPRTGMLAEESQFWNIDLENSVMIGDNASDVEWAQNAGLGRVFWLDNPELREKSPANMTNVTQVQSLDQILKLI